MAMAADEVIHNWGQVLIPIDKQMEKLIQPGQNRRDGKTKAQNLVSLLRGVVRERSDGKVRSREMHEEIGRG